MSNDKVYDLEERTARFGEEIIKFARMIPKDVVTLPIIGQLVKSGTSVGANYCEADCAETRKDFEHKLGICKKESKETKHWLRMLITTTPELKDRATELMKETNELTLIFVAIIKKSKANKIKELSI
ncbi:MAG: four helix bundle protein [Candidatus Doudnabacteria bacterium RIFCSPLOWO2_02_FULL_49_13]|uniref:Four helix bundle protein n=1 Tax=Candidatus Doudnabacteria bacterium RIFCSPHIGHO2_12_FULL_48_16 TaxID=1817838 RepID=A0A1F5PLG3_9BACT|nr:MAG: four helix bundle protein [Candidatus Doudnabacteria bacterium RIFCSPHIGHO2_02_FULL_49_24]OGE88760.1 MAG: four helix bundle protein [Candidatus Doudnabacteria bacterium RIFCSPHIGHO2_01_FULL_50_67]OGE90719.1 MAG: four helix bundle protein [Candidatus Doudnabacteria bacterium RIFCSPHIGHO2_12_FULL_48_16]OGE97786.1 MAG: four helix bundle protein [Candidatus Doudnabacteria bacterium RIFCSPLOWO2_01_FULL_49_40]OGF02582.1 MAG: four helix bundle protein [Candidatus Doudnabacteria bacterium RIFCS